MYAPILIAVELVTLYTIDGRPVMVNPFQVTQLHEAREAGDPKKQLTGKVGCIIHLSAGQYVTVRERCNLVREMLRREDPP